MNQGLVYLTNSNKLFYGEGYYNNVPNVTCFNNFNNSLIYFRRDLMKVFMVNQNIDNRNMIEKSIIKTEDKREKVITDSSLINYENPINGDYSVLNL